ncbi:uncharacterized protein Z518_05643 [Rhinocladiella mackenziei CBS 650.93]|uniref:Rhinocladiella mackenziei CBS 650.93 unplaced genomic scaffold supercont1.4, whole genome shotgun sequence n=1 Tax=Rhinocladiella mackenziei CBS 650.93 TaxID=1442369 RepID=A0A0D2H2V9_9EURO|nr:uncharacterized protein Z518_05643 [Rhinocladiella mackenziei CBS 650.93]KIX04773.1 hypothetical protein Z518_05643 [Rhinocladiella mackenziei CBS 650.93]
MKPPVGPTAVLLIVLSLLTSSSSSLLPRQTQDNPWSASKFHSLITFGDSYTDESRLGWFINHNGSAPPPGAFLPESFTTAGGGRTWPRYVVQYTGTTKEGTWSPQMTLYNYAVSGAVCSNKVSPRWLSAIDAPFPAVLEYEIPAFLADVPAQRVNATPVEPLFTPALTAQSAVYALWIGTNDLGVWAFLTDSQIRGKVLTDYTSCVYEVFDKLYAGGGRRFVLMNTVPLHLAPLYANDTLHGVGANQYWPHKPTNHTRIAETMHEFTAAVNDVFKYQTPFEVLVAKRYPGAHFAIFDTFSLISDIYNSPGKYLNGTGVKKDGESVWGYENHCNVNQTSCVKRENGTNPDGFLWFDELHPSEQTDRLIARNFVEVLNGTSKYASYY